MFCHKCGAQNPNDGQFCTSCGEKLYMNQAQQTPPSGYPYQSPVQPQNPYQSQYNQSYQQTEMYYQYKSANNAATASLVCGIIGLFLFGLILGIIAIVQGNKAKNLGYTGGKATAGIVLGVIGIIGWAIIMIVRFG